jgi:hypothetical protein
MDRQIAIASVIALTLATVVKIHAPVEVAANTEMANTRIQTAGTIQPSAFTQPDPMWLVGP